MDEFNFYASSGHFLPAYLKCHVYQARSFNEFVKNDIFIEFSCNGYQVTTNKKPAGFIVEWYETKVLLLYLPSTEFRGLWPEIRVSVIKSSLLKRETLFEFFVSTEKAAVMKNFTTGDPKPHWFPEESQKQILLSFELLGGKKIFLNNFTLHPLKKPYHLQLVVLGLRNLGFRRLSPVKPFLRFYYENGLFSFK